MIHPRWTRLPRRAVFVALLSAALLLALSLGLRHRIVHGAPGDVAAAHAQHSCAAFDSATLGDRLPTISIAFECLRTPAQFFCDSIPGTWSALVTVHFSARAPPGLPVRIAGVLSDAIAYPTSRPINENEF